MIGSTDIPSWSKSNDTFCLHSEMIFIIFQADVTFRYIYPPSAVKMMHEILKNEKDSNKEIVSHYDLLKQTGILDQIEDLEQQIKSKDKLLDEITELLNQTTRMDLINFITTRMLNELVPMNLAFIIQSEYSMDQAEVICFDRLKRVDNDIQISSIKPYRVFFSHNPGLVTFEKFRENIDNQQLADIFLPLEPEFIMPLIGLGGMFGFILFGKKIIKPGYSNREIEYIERIVKCASVCLQNNMHYRSAIIDDKTNLYTHYFFLRRFHEELSRVIRYNMKISVIMLDLDHFKCINDTYGHTAGDKVLYEVARIIEKYTRKGDIAARFGGEEFIILLIECTSDNAFKSAERIRKAIEGLHITNLDKEITITLSCGISSISQSSEIDAEEIIRQADRALYLSKQNGRNRTTVYNE